MGLWKPIVWRSWTRSEGLAVSGEWTTRRSTTSWDPGMSYKELAQAWTRVEGHCMTRLNWCLSFTFLNKVWRSFPANVWQGGRSQASVPACWSGEIVPSNSKPDREHQEEAWILYSFSWTYDEVSSMLCLYSALFQRSPWHSILIHPCGTWWWF